MPSLRFSTQGRVWVTAAILAGATLLLHGVSHSEATVLGAPLQQIPLAIGDWQGDDIALDADTLAILRVSDYVNRTYQSRTAPPVSLYVGYYRSQRTGDSIHSPKNCLPGSGWEPVWSGRWAVEIPGREPIVVNSYLVQKGFDRELVFYWYQSQGRVIASEYRAKLWMAIDAVTRNRTDGALVRFVTSTVDGQGKAQGRLDDFVRRIYPLLQQSIPN